MNEFRPGKNEVIWLIKSGDRILGPYSGDAIERLLLSREIVLIDEVKRSFGRWKYLREEVFFAVIVEKMRAGNQSKIEDTEHGTLSNPTATLTGTADISKTFDLEMVDREGAQSAYIQDAEFVDIDVDSKTPPPAPIGKQFGITSHPNVQKNIRKSSSTAWVFSLIFVGIALTIAYKIQMKPANVPQVPDFSKIVDLANKNYHEGYFADSLKYYKEASALKPYDPDVIIGMAPLLLSIEGQKVEVKRKIGEVLAIVHSEDQVKQSKNILGLVAIADEDFEEASRQFTDAIRIDQKYLPALFNLGVVHFLQKDYLTSEKDFSSVVVEDPQNAPAAYMFIRSKLALALANKNPNFGELRDPVTHFLKTYYDLKQEVSLINSFIISKQEAKNSLTEHIRSTLEADPFVTDEFLRDPQFSFTQLSWIHLTSYCEELSQKLPSSADMKALHAVCLFKTGRAQEGPKLIEEALAQTPNDSLFLSVKAYILMTSGRAEEAHAALELAQKAHPNILSKILMGRMCMKTKDDKCVRENFQNLGQQDFTPAIAAVGLAEVAEREGSLNSAKLYRYQLKPFLPNYLPALRLESEFGEN